MNNIPRSTFTDRLKTYRTHKENAIYFFREYKQGRPPKLDSIALEKVKDTIIQRRKASMALTQKEFRTAEKRVKGEVKYSVLVTPQTKTNARILAEGDPRNVLTMAIMMKCFCEHMNPKLLFNWDATQYEVNHDKNMKTIVILNEIDDIPPLLSPVAHFPFLSNITICIMLWVMWLHRCMSSLMMPYSLKIWLLDR